MAAFDRRHVAVIIAVLLVVGISSDLTMDSSPDPDQSAIWPPATVPADIPPVEGPAAEAGSAEYLSGCPSAAEMQVQDVDAREITLEFAMSAPEDSWFVQRLREAAALVKDQTAGRVSIKIYPGGIMGSDRKATMKVMSRGNFLQGAVVSSASLADAVPELGIYGIPMLFRSPDEVTHLRKTLDPLLHDALQEWCLVSFGFAGNGFTHLFSRLPVQTGQDLNGNSVWIP